VNSSPNETIIALEPESVIGVWVGVVEVDGVVVEVVVDEGIIRWLKTKHPAIPAMATIPIMITIFTSPF
jgi:hypothetical protein